MDKKTNSDAHFCVSTEMMKVEAKCRRKLMQVSLVVQWRHQVSYHESKKKKIKLLLLRLGVAVIAALRVGNTNTGAGFYPIGSALALFTLCDCCTVHVQTLSCPQSA
ncbi:hypothetical protein L915_14925 [Phytophthora nicotianae]|uniref:Uncharacterized protein n=1 Tax=Phytophthora nicotianae TaxID=4792 RepID=W2GAE4_PHYNI|nr:hypothetical protein L915_14925 [Phytophthora nicotianae]